MSTGNIDAKKLAGMFLTGAKSLEAKKDWINELNVFPVPDGDTGTNMTMTIMTPAREVATMGLVEMKSLCKTISSGSLRGARGNSGVILSQLLRGFCKGVSEEESIDIETLASACNKAVETAYKAVMKPKEGTILTVARGVAEKASELSSQTDDMEYFLGELVKQAEDVLKKTPDMLPVLKQAGVVDSGGQGLVEILKGAYQAYIGNETVFSYDNDNEAAAPAVTNASSYEVQKNFEIKFGYCTEFIILLDKVFNMKNEQDFKNYLESIGDSIVCVADEDCVKVHVHTNDPGLAIQKALTYGQLSRMKIDNMREEHQEKLFNMSGANGPVVKEAPAHNSAPVKPVTENFEKADNIPEQTAYANSAPVNNPPAEEVQIRSGQDETVSEPVVKPSSDEPVQVQPVSEEVKPYVPETFEVNESAPAVPDTEPDPEDLLYAEAEEVYPEVAVSEQLRKDIGFISISMGAGMESIFKGLGVDVVISGGQTMNPSTEDMLKAVDAINADNIFILPNNKNIIMAANQVQYMSDDKKIYVIPTRTVPQGITALINYTIGMSADDNDKAMKESITGVKTGQVTYAVRDTVINGLSIKRGNIMGIGDKDILSIGDSIHDTSMEMIDKMVDDSSELISIYYGKDTDPQDADDFSLDVAVRFPKCDVEMHYGGQPIYYYVVSVE
ncbi:MAG: DAK2 domain-containing protein [Lachnospiraceae bacterium]|nr:DAK2 domain-containing protein [Lachnospiraceae bacterium]